MKQLIRHILKEETSLKSTVRELVKSEGFIRASKIVGSLDEVHKILGLKGTKEDVLFIVSAILENDLNIDICGFNIVRTLVSVKIYVTILKSNENRNADDWYEGYRARALNMDIAKMIYELGNGLVRGHSIDVQVVEKC